MEANLQTLRHRGFPVDRILKPVVPPPSPPPQPDPVPIIESADTNNSHVRDQAEASTNGYTSNDGFDTILSQMFPNCPPNVIQGMLGDNPSKEKAREVANELSSMGASDTNDKPHSRTTKEEDNSLSNGKESHRNKQMQSETKVKKKSGGIVGKMIGGLRPGSAGGIKPPSRGKRVVHQQQASEPSSSHNGTSPLPQNDAASQQSLEAMLQDSVESTRTVQSAGVSAPETLLKTLPQGLECGSEGKPNGSLVSLLLLCSHLGVGFRHPIQVVRLSHSKISFRSKDLTAPTLQKMESEFSIQETHRHPTSHKTLIL